MARPPLRSHRESSGRRTSENSYLRTLTLNIGAAAARRADEILSWLVRRQDDVIVLTETSAGAGTLLLEEGLRERGYEVVATRPEKDRGVLIATRIQVRSRLCSEFDVTLPWRIASVRLATAPSLVVLGVYVPSRDRSKAKIARKKRFIRSFLCSVQALPREVRRHLVIAGDFNVVSRDHMPPRRNYFPYEYELHEALADLGLLSTHELLKPREHPHTWIGRTGDGYLYDYFHVGEALRDRVEICRYIDDTRSLGLSDHRAVVVRWRVAAGAAA